MLNMLDAVLAVVLMGVVLYGFTTLRTDLSDVGDAQRIAYAYEDMHDSLQAYLDSYYPQIERCLRGDRWAAAWRDRQLRFRRGDSGSARPPDHSTFIPLPLFSDTRLTGTPGRFASLSPADGLYGGRSTGAEHAAHLRTMPDTDCLPPVAFAGTLAPSFRSLEYERGPTPSDHLFDDRYDFRAAVRLINSDEAPNIIDPTVGVQIVLVMRTPPGEPIPLAKALRIAELTRKPDVGILSSLGVGASVANSTLAGIGDGWRMTVCQPPTADLGRETAAERVRLATPPPAPSPLSGLGLGSPGDAAARTSVGIPACGAGDWLDSDVLPVYGIFQTSPVARLFQSGAAGALQEMLSGQPITNANAPHAARVVSVIHKSRTAALRDVLYRSAIPGMPERQRMQADLDMGAYGISNAGFITGVDTDGDGVVNQGVQIIGPHTPSAPHGCTENATDYRLDCTGGTQQPNLVATTFHGPVHIRGGPLVITDADTDFPQDPANVGNNFPPASLVVAGATFLGPRDPGDLLDPAWARASVAGTAEVNVEAPRGKASDSQPVVNRRVYRSAGALRIDEDSDVVHVDTGAFHVAADQSSAGHQRPPILLEAGSDATGRDPAAHVDYPGGGAIQLIARADGAAGATTAAGPSGGVSIRATGTESDTTMMATGASGHAVVAAAGAGGRFALRGESATSTGYIGVGAGRAGAFDRPVTAAGGLAIETTGDSTPVIFNTRGANSSMLIFTSGASSPIHAETRRPDSSFSVATRGDRSGLSLRTRGAAAALTAATYGAGSLLRTRTYGATSPINFEARGDGSNLTVQTRGANSNLSLLTAGATSTLSARTWGASSPLTVETVNTDSLLHLQTQRARSSLFITAAGDASHMGVRTHGANSTFQIYTNGGTSPLQIFTRGASSPMTVQTQGNTSNLNVGVLAGSAELNLNRLSLPDADTTSQGLTLDAIYRNLYNANSVRTAGNTWPPATTCPGGFTAVDFLVPTGWSRANFAATLDRTLVFRVPGHGSSTATFSTHEPYTGWSINPTTGRDDGTGGSSTAGSYDFTTVRLCSFTATASP